MNFKRCVLKNGITVLYEKRDLPLTALSVSHRIGASSESADIKGVSHVIEHMLFTGTKSMKGEQISRQIENKGGILNAFTSQDVTSYWFKLPSEHAFLGAKILIDMLKNSVFDKKKFEREKKVVLEEIRMYHDTPQRHVHEKILENLYDSPFSLGISGTQETVSSLKRDFVFDYYKKFYSPENYIVTIVGDIDFDKICSLFERSFKPQNLKAPVTSISLRNGHSVEERKGIDQAHLVFAMHAPPGNHHDLYALEVLDSYLTGGMSSRLSLEIREKRGLAYAVMGSITVEKTHSYYSIYVGTRKESVDKVKKIILKELKDVSKMTSKDLNEHKQRLIGLKKVSMEESTNVMNELLFAELITGNAKTFYDYENEIKKVTLAQVKKLAKINDFSTASIIPK